MNDRQWRQLLAIVNGEKTERPVAGFIIDSPWLPGWHSISTLQYYTSDANWFAANRAAIETFPNVLFLPGFWAEYGMCTEPSAFGSKLVWQEFDLPHADRVLAGPEDIGALPCPNVKTDGLLPFVIQRLKNKLTRVSDLGHAYRFAVARGPLNIASFLMGTTEFLMLLATDSEQAHQLLNKLTDFVVAWLRYQKETFESIDGIMVLDDIVGFVGEEDYRQFAGPNLKRCFAAFEASVRLFHNDANGRVCAPHLADAGVNIFNFGFEHSMDEMRSWVGEDVVLLGNIPPRDVLAGGSQEDVAAAVQHCKDSIEDHRRIIWSCGGGMPQKVPTANLGAFVKAL